MYIALAYFSLRILKESENCHKGSNMFEKYQSRKFPLRSRNSLLHHKYFTDFFYGKHSEKFL